MSKVAVQLLSYDGEHFLAKAIAALRAQTSDDFELLVLDNGSADDSGGRISFFAK